MVKGISCRCTDQASLEWIKENIVDAKLDWDEAKTNSLAFSNVLNDSLLQMKSFKACKQLPGESVQSYSDRFQDIVNEMNRGLILIHL